MSSENTFDTKGMMLEGLAPEQASILKPFAEKIHQYFEQSQVSIPEKIYQNEEIHL